MIGRYLLLASCLAYSGCQAETVSEIVTKCDQKDTVLCKDGKVNPDVLMFDEPVEQDCLVDAFFKDITETKMRSITEWMDSCQSLEYRESGFRPISKQVEKRVFTCSIGGHEVVVDEYTPHSTSDYTLENCIESKVMVSEPLSPCLEETELDVCVDKQPDMTVVDPRVRKDCGALDKRSDLWQDLVEGCNEAYDEWMDECGNNRKLGRRRELNFHGKCGSGKMMHLKHFQNLRGADSKLHISGSFSGFLTIPGTVQSLSPSNDCEVTSVNGIVKVNPIGTQYCDISIKDVAGDGLAFEFCDGI